MNSAVTVTVAVIALIGTVTGTVLSYRAASRANAISARKVDSEAYDRAAIFYDKLLASADRELTRLRGQVDGLHNQFDRVNNQLNQEQDVSNVLREQVRALQLQVRTLESTVLALRELMPHRHGANHDGSEAQR